ncbi:hypothetical protein PGT21_010782 [Puccinia graminis f. sp. tritici]|uniref:Uncharacterized protein n=1 Tax=Puccinia graminis f. sp. tritici TaxID=56615 RepID=A0A5B0QEY2_PUCGR|nr:hypothetical protein PGT21_010782 [Puccinia graminis f. sp. tritici]
MSSLNSSSIELKTSLQVERRDRPQIQSSRLSIWVLMQTQSLSLYFLLISILLLSPHGASASFRGDRIIAQRAPLNAAIYLSDTDINSRPGSSMSAPNSGSSSSTNVPYSSPSSSTATSAPNSNPISSTNSLSSSPSTSSGSNSSPSTSTNAPNFSPSSFATAPNSSPNTPSSAPSSYMNGPISANPNSYVNGPNTNPTSSGDSGPQCGFHQSMYQNTTDGAAPASTTSTDHGIKVPDCYQALGHLLHERNGASMFRMNGTTKRKSCGTCRLLIEGNYTKELLVPLGTVMFGTNKQRSGGLNGLFISCHKRGGQVTLQAGGKLKTPIRIDVSKASTNRNCSQIAS